MPANESYVDIANRLLINPPPKIPTASEAMSTAALGAQLYGEPPSMMTDIRTLPAGVITPEGKLDTTGSDPYKGGQVTARTQAPQDVAQTGGFLPREVKQPAPETVPPQQIPVPQLQPTAEKEIVKEAAKKTEEKKEEKKEAKDATKPEEKPEEKPLDLQWLEALLYGLSDISKTAVGKEGRAIEGFLDRVARERQQQKEFEARMKEIMQQKAARLEEMEAGTKGQERLTRLAAELAQKKVPQSSSGWAARAFEMGR
jgi:outer membrane biosynthesis protein TonB